jgi:hypothetical protein
MTRKKRLAQIGVFVFLGLNVGAYFFFWPNHQGGSNSESKSLREENGTAQLVPAPEKQSNPVQVYGSSVNRQGNVDSLNNPASAQNSEMDASQGDVVARLLDHIKKDSAVTNKAPVAHFNEKNGEFPAKRGDPSKKSDNSVSLTLPKENKPKPLPPLNADPLVPEVSNSNIGVTSALTAKVPPGTWLLHTETLGEQTLLVAKLRQTTSMRPPAEFRILGDRVEMNGPNGDVQAVDRVTFIGTGLKGACRRLTLQWNELRLVFEGQVSIETVAGGKLSGDRITWEIPAPAALVNPPILGAPKHLQ